MGTRTWLWVIDLIEKALDEPQSCGHPIACIVNGKDGVQHCEWCDSLVQEREKARRPFAWIFNEAKANIHNNQLRNHIEISSHQKAAWFADFYRVFEAGENG